MDETEIKLEFHNYDNQCRVCLSIGRKLSPLGEYHTIFKRIISEVDNLNQLLLEDIRLCWECFAFLQRARIFQQKVQKANEVLQLGQVLDNSRNNIICLAFSQLRWGQLPVSPDAAENQCFTWSDCLSDLHNPVTWAIGYFMKYIYSTQSSLTTVLLNDSHPHTIYINDLNLHFDVKTCNDENDEIGEQCDEVCEENDGEDSVSLQVKEELNKEQQKPKNNRWAKKRAMQNKKPKFKIITEYSKDCFRKIEIDNKEIPLLMQSERDSEYFKSKRFKCDKCVLVFSSEKFLEKHNNKYHNKSTSYTCDICTSSISNKRLLSRHVKAHYNKYSCTICDFTCYDKSQTKWHYQKSHRKIFQCVKCELKFGSRKEFFKHYKQWHEKFICDYCGISFKMRYCIKDHIRKQHGEFVCTACNKRWARYNGLWLHNKTAHGTREPAYCVECDTHYADIYRYRWHLANSTKHTKHKKHRIPCPGCDKIFSKNIYMKDHYNLVHLKHFKYRCEQCDKNFIRNADLVKHTRRVHEGILPPKNKICYICGRGFSTNKILTNHLRTHTGEKPFACTICNARFAQSTALSAHARAIHHTVQKHD